MGELRNSRRFVAQNKLSHWSTHSVCELSAWHLCDWSTFFVWNTTEERQKKQRHTPKYEGIFRRAPLFRLCDGIKPFTVISIPKNSITVNKALKDKGTQKKRNARNEGRNGIPRYREIYIYKYPYSWQVESVHGDTYTQTFSKRQRQPRWWTSTTTNTQRQHTSEWPEMRMNIYTECIRKPTTNKYVRRSMYNSMIVWRSRSK